LPTFKKDKKETASKAEGIVGQSTGNVFRRKKDTVTICTNCKNEVDAGYKFCPACGQSIATEKKCITCDEMLPVDFSFCPYCGAAQNE